MKIKSKSKNKEKTNLIKKLFDSLENSIENSQKKKKKKLKRLKNVTPKVLFDKDGNIIHPTEKKDAENLTSENEKTISSEKKSVKGSTIHKKAKEKKQKDNDDAYDVVESYDFPGDIIKVVKNQIRNFFTMIFGSPEEDAKIETEKKERLFKIDKNTKFGKIIYFFYEKQHYAKVKFMSFSKKTKAAIIFSSLLLILLFIAAIFNAWVVGFLDVEKAKSVSDEDFSKLEKFLNEKYIAQRSEDLKPLPYKVNPAKLDVKAGAAILVDASNGCVLYEKNADAKIPPASLTKLFVMYIVFQDVKMGRISMDDVVPLPELSWAINLPRDASLMHLGQGQNVTLKELMTGLAVASGNDAARAVAYYVSGSQEAFVERMNQECKRLGLFNTHFVETSGYDENNITTARDLAKFARIYITRYPESIEEFHSKKYLDYPLKANLPSWQKDFGDSKAIHHVNTNPLLGLMEGVDGLKTGFIYESGYNLALTVKRGNQRFLSITLQGQGKGTKQGNAGRIHDGTEMMEWAFSTFSDYNPADYGELEFPIPSLATKDNNCRFVKLIPAWKNKIAVPHLVGNTAKDSADSVNMIINTPRYIYGKVNAGEVYGQIQYKLGEITLETVPLVADRTLEESGLWGKICGTFAKRKLSNSKIESE